MKMYEPSKFNFQYPLNLAIHTTSSLRWQDQIKWLKYHYILHIKTKRVTRVELNKRLRHKEQQKKAAEAKKLEDLSKEIDSIPEIMEEIKQEDEEKQKNMLR